jgi:hypothetical protein
MLSIPVIFVFHLFKSLSKLKPSSVLSRCTWDHRTDESPRLVDVLIDSITNVRRELKFFEDVASRYGLKLEAKEVSEGVRRYRELFFSVGEEIERHKREMLDGLIVLWGTEKVRSLVYFPRSLFSFMPVSAALFNSGSDRERREN